jgi:hypothetical protein
MTEKHPPLSLAGYIVMQRESEKGTGQVPSVLPILKGGWFLLAYVKIKLCAISGSQCGLQSLHCISRACYR